jgi:hypothetical protein
VRWVEEPIIAVYADRMNLGGAATIVLIADNVNRIDTDTVMVRSGPPYFNSVMPIPGKH